MTQPTSQPGSPIAKLTQGIIGLVVLVALGVVGVVALRATGILSFDSARGGALMEARRAVQAKLKSPGSADFETTRVAAQTEDGEFRLVYVEVDSQNGFGALVRTFALVLTSHESDADETTALGTWLFESSPSLRDAEAIMQDGWSGDRKWVLEDWLGK